MTEFKCKIPGCENKARRESNGMCLDCALKDIKTREEAPRPEPMPGGEKRCPKCNYPLTKNDKCRSCAIRRRWAKKNGAEPEKEEQAPVSEVRKCTECGEELTAKARKGLCRSCIKKAANQKFLKKKSTPRPATAPSRESNSDGIIGKLLNRFHASLNEAREIHGALTTIKELTGAEIEIPEIRA